MRKAIRLVVQLWIEADDEPAHDFADSTMKTVREILADGAPHYPELRLTVEKIFEVRSSDDDEAR